MQELAGLEIEFAFDGDTQYIDGNPVLVFGEQYGGNIVLRNPSNYQYVITNIEAADDDMKVSALEEKYVMPGETRIVSFEIDTSRTRKKPFKMGVICTGGYIL